MYNNERQALLKPNDVIIGTITRSKLQTDIAEKIGVLFDSKLKLLTDTAFFDHNSNIDHYSAHSKRTVIAVDEYTFGVFRESTKEYADIKRSYDAYVRRYKSYLVTARIDTLYPDKFDEFIQAKEERQAEMSKLKRKLINYGLPSEELYELGEKFKREIRVIAERMIKCE